MNVPTGDDCTVSPYGSGGIVRIAAEASYDALHALRDDSVQPPDVNGRPAGFDALQAVRGLLGPYEPARTAGPPVGVVEQERSWGDMAAALLPGIVSAVGTAVRHLENRSGQPVEVVGAHGDAAQRLAELREFMRAGRPVVSVSATGPLDRLLITGRPDVASLSLLCWMPEQPLAAATVTTESVLTADCSDAYRLRHRPREWEQLLDDTKYPVPQPGYVVLPDSLAWDRERVLTEFAHPEFVEETTSAIIQAVLNHSVPAAIHVSGDVLNSAILLVAAGHGLSVRLHTSEGAALTPWDASKMLFKAVRAGDPVIPGLVVARDDVTALRLARHLGLHSGPVRPPEPLPGRPPAGIRTPDTP